MKRILTARSNAGVQITLDSTMSKSLLKQLRQQFTFYCIQCQEKVILRVGDVNIPHFSHLQQTTCRDVFSEGESILHLEGKQVLWSFFQQQGLSVQLEPYIQQLAQRPDLLVSYQNDVFPIEFQCSTITSEAMRKRTAGYLSHGWNPIWLIRTFPKWRHLPQGVGVVQLSPFQQRFFSHRSLEGTMLLSFDPPSRTFHYFSHILPVTGRTFMVNHRKLPISYQTFPFALPKLLTSLEMTQYARLFQQHRQQFLQNRIRYNRKGIQDPFLQDCYELRLLPGQLPHWIGVPSESHEAFSCHPCEWQLSLLAYLRRQELSLEMFGSAPLGFFLQRFKGQREALIYAMKAYIELLQSTSYETMEEGEWFEMMIARRFLAKRYEN